MTTPSEIERRRAANRKSYARPEARAARKARYLRDRQDPLKVAAQRVRVKVWDTRNKDRRRTWNVQYRKHLRRTDPWWALRNRLSARIWFALVSGKGKKAAKTQELIGCTVEQLQAHIESKFTDGMSWEKLLAGEIHIDHIKPCALFDLTNPAEQKACFHFTNLQPLWAGNNLTKGAKYAK